jgi:sugar phosphate isomerase/epimerase
MDIGISTGLFYDRDIAEALPLIKEAGFGLIEVWAGPDKNGEYNHFNWRQKHKVQALCDLLKKLDIKVSSLHAPFSDDLDISSSNELKRKVAVNEVLRTLEILKQLGGQYLVLHPASTGSSPKDRDKLYKQSRKSIEDVFRCMSGMELKLAVENQLPHILGGDIRTLLSLIEGLPAKDVGICYDSSHANLYGGYPVENSFKDLAERIMTVHISDNNCTYDDHLMPGDGKINWQSFVEAMAQSGYKGEFMLEVLCDARKSDKRAIIKNTYNKAKEILATGS